MRSITKNSIKLFLIVGIFFSLLSSVGCHKKEDNVIKIGAILPLTGALAGFEEEYLRGIELATRDIKNVEVIIEDGKGNPKESILAFNKFYNIQGIKIFLVVECPVVLAIKPLIVHKEALLFADASRPEITEENHWNIFRHSDCAYQKANFLYSVS